MLIKEASERIDCSANMLVKYPRACGETFAESNFYSTVMDIHLDDVTCCRTYTWIHSGDLGKITRIYLTHDSAFRSITIGFLPVPVGPGWFVDKVSCKFASTHLSLNNMADMLQIVFSNQFSWMTIMTRFALVCLLRSSWQLYAIFSGYMG